MNQMLTVTSCKIVGPVDLPSCTKLCLPNWQSDNSSTICKQCGSAFSIFNRRHHCRRCGKLCDYKCVKKVAVPELGYNKPVQVCIDCYQKVLVKTTLFDEQKEQIKLKEETPKKIPVDTEPSYNFVPGDETKKLSSLYIVDSYTTDPFKEVAPPSVLYSLVESETSITNKQSSQSYLTEKIVYNTTTIEESITYNNASYTMDLNNSSKPPQPQTQSLTQSKYVGEEVQNMINSQEDDIEIKRFENEVLEDESTRGSVLGETMLRDWNKDFQNLVRTIKESSFSPDRSNYRSLNQITKQFTDTATLYAEIIISEICLPQELKTIKSIDVGGIAGGQKFLCHGILFKFALDTQIRNHPPQWMYGGSKPDDSKAMKAASNELLGLGAHLTTHTSGLNYPLMALIDYKGFRVIAITVLPIDKTTIQYGSSDGGRNVYAKNEQLNEKMQNAGKQLNLKGHKTGKLETIIYGPGDIEGHLGHDNQFYVVDFGRLMPPEDPSFFDEPDGRAVFYYLLRPELVISNPVPLNPDAFTGWNAEEEEVRIQDNMAITEATKRLYEVIIPSYVKELEETPFPWEKIFDLKTDMYFLKKVFGVITGAKLHAHGINLRHLGFVRSQCKNLAIRRALLCCCIARIMKNVVKERMRKKMRQVQVPSDLPFKSEVIYCFNLIASKSDVCDIFWKFDIKKELTRKFKKCLTEEESNPNYDLRNSADIRVTFLGFLKLSGVKLNRKILNKFMKNPKEFEKLVEEDVKSISAIKKHDHITYLSAANELYLKSQETAYPAETKRLLYQANRHFTLAYQSSPVCHVIVEQWADSLFLLTQYVKNKEKRVFFLKNTFFLFEMAIKYKVHDPQRIIKKQIGVLNTLILLVDNTEEKRTVENMFQNKTEQMSKF